MHCTETYLGSCQTSISYQCYFVRINNAFATLQLIWEWLLHSIDKSKVILLLFHVSYQIRKTGDSTNYWYNLLSVIHFG